MRTGGRMNRRDEANSRFSQFFERLMRRHQNAQFCIYIYIYIYTHTHTHIYTHIHTHTHGVTGGTDQTSGECSLGQTIPI